MTSADTLEIARLVGLTEAAAVRELGLAAPPETVERLRLRVETFGSAVVTVAPGWPITPVNRVVGLGLAEPATEATLDAVLGFAEEVRAPAFGVSLSPAAGPEALPRWLEERGFAPKYTTAVLYRSLDSPPEPRSELRVKQIGPERAAVFADVLVSGFPLPDLMRPWLAATVGRPGWHHYLAFGADGEPVAAASMLRAGGVAYLNWAATLEPHRRRGAQSALIARRLRDAAELGCRLAATDTDEDRPEDPDPSFANMRRLGFELLHVRPNLVRR